MSQLAGWVACGWSRSGHRALCLVNILAQGIAIACGSVRDNRQSVRRSALERGRVSGRSSSVVSHLGINIAARVADGETGAIHGSCAPFVSPRTMLTWLLLLL